MNKIVYLCPECSKELGISGFRATNEVGRKYCEICGGNKDNLVVISAKELKDNQ